MDEAEAQVVAHNTRELWRDVENHLRVARESVEQAMSALDDLQLSANANVSKQIAPLVPVIELWRIYAEGCAR